MVPEPPAYLSAYAREEWHRAAPELWHLGVLTTIDTTMFAAYCETYAHWRTAEEKLAGMAARDPVTDGLLIRTIAGDARQNPLVRIARNAAADLLMFAGQFGMTPAARARIAAGIGPEPPSKFGDLLA